MSNQFGNNVNIDVTSIGTEITFHKEDGTSTETNIYLDIDNPILTRLHIANDKAFVIIDINGEEFTNPRTVSATKGFGLKSSYDHSIESVKIRTTEATTHLEVMMW